MCIRDSVRAVHDFSTYTYKVYIIMIVLVIISIISNNIPYRKDYIYILFVYIYTYTYEGSYYYSLGFDPTMV